MSMKQKPGFSLMKNSFEHPCKSADLHKVCVTPDGEAHVWPSFQQLRESLQCRARDQPECAYRFDEAY